MRCPTRLWTSLAASMCLLACSCTQPADECTLTPTETDAILSKIIAWETMSMFWKTVDTPGGLAYQLQFVRGGGDLFVHSEEATIANDLEIFKHVEEWPPDYDGYSCCRLGPGEGWLGAVDEYLELMAAAEASEWGYYTPRDEERIRKRRASGEPFAPDLAPCETFISMKQVERAQVDHLSDAEIALVERLTAEALLEWADGIFTPEEILDARVELAGPRLSGWLRGVAHFHINGEDGEPDSIEERTFSVRTDLRKEPIVSEAFVQMPVDTPVEPERYPRDLTPYIRAATR